MSDEPKALVPIEERPVDSYGDELTAAPVPTRGQAPPQAHVPIRPIGEHLGLAWPPQDNRIQQDAVLSEVASSVTVTVTEAGQRGAMVCRPLKFPPAGPSALFRGELNTAGGLQFMPTRLRAPRRGCPARYAGDDNGRE
jgi:hypothetical protein